ncbi:MAG: leucine-rich repeat domain-containing protein [Clostridia bacterium]|nr:leucine-rich repeat domain-containing protein [Clostridia bacterium]
MKKKTVDLINEKISELEKDFSEKLQELKKELILALDSEDTQGQDGQAASDNAIDDEEYIMAPEDNIFACQQIPRGIIITGFNTLYKGGDIVIPSKIGKTPVIEVQAGAFKEKESITGVKIAKGIKIIREKAFAYCNYIEKIEIPDTVTTIEPFAFTGCNSVKEISLPSSVTSIGEKAFYHCESLRSVYIPKSVEAIGKNAFYMCNELKVYCEADSKPQAWDNDWLGVGIPTEKKLKKVLWGM